MTTHADEDWNRLVVAATLGTHRTGADRPRHRGELGAFCSRVARQTTEELLLADVAAAALWRTCGAKPRRVAHAVQVPAPIDDRPVASVVAGDLLVRALEDSRPELAREWCRIAVAFGVRVPDELVPMMIELLDSHPSTRMEDTDDTVRASMGARGEWFRSLRGGASSAPLSVEPSAEFAVASGAARRESLRRWRRQAPADARSALEACFAECGADERADLLGELVHGLSAQDEAFLEACARDRAKSVRAVATDLLARLDGSALSSRLRSRLGQLVQYRPAKLLRSASLTITAPEAESPELIRDGIEASARGKLGAKAAALHEIVKRTRLSIWTDEFGIPADRLCDLLSEDEWRSAVLTGLCESAVRHGDSDWARRLLEVGVPFDAGILRDVPAAHGYAAQLAACVHENDRDALVAKLGAQGHLSSVTTWLQVAGPRWSRETSRAFVEWMTNTRPRKPDDVDPLLSWPGLRQVAVSIDPDVVDFVSKRLEDALRDAAPAVKNQVDALVDTLTLRQRTRKELQREQDSH